MEYRNNSLGCCLYSSCWYYVVRIFACDQRWHSQCGWERRVSLESFLFVVRSSRQVQWTRWFWKGQRTGDMGSLHVVEFPVTGLRSGPFAARLVVFDVTLVTLVELQVHRATVSVQVLAIFTRHLLFFVLISLRFCVCIEPPTKLGHRSCIDE